MRSRRIVFAPLLGLGLACAPAGPAPFSDADRAAIEAHRTAFLAAANAGDWAAVMPLYEENAVLMPPNAPRWRGTLAIREGFNQMPPVGQFTFFGVSFHPAGDLVAVEGGYALVVMPPGSSLALPDTGKFVELWRRQDDGSWKAAVIIWNSDLAPPAPPPGPGARR
jgi:ketosteroid isomerase-like protein